MKAVKLAAVVFAIIGPHNAFASSTAMPDEVSNISMGMPMADLLKARPNISREGMLGSKIRWDAPRLVLYETFPKGGDYMNASYLIDGGKLVSAALVGHPAAGRESEARKKALKNYVAKWGKNYHKRILKDEMRPGQFFPMLTWDVNDAEVILTLPKERKKGDSKINPLAIQVRTRAEAQKEGWKEAEMSPKDRAKYFKDHDVDEN